MLIFETIWVKFHTLSAETGNYLTHRPSLQISIEFTICYTAITSLASIYKHVLTVQEAQTPINRETLRTLTRTFYILGHLFEASVTGHEVLDATVENRKCSYVAQCLERCFNNQLAHDAQCFTSTRKVWSRIQRHESTAACYEIILN
jgi:hypothetical protein